MKIKDVGLSNAEQPFSAVLYIDDCLEDNLDDNDRLNARLSEIENAAHDTFVIDDEDFNCDPITKRLVEFIYKNTQDIILEKTKIEVLDETPLEGLDEMLAIQGVLTTKITKNKSSIKKKKTKMRKKALGKKSDDYEKGVSRFGGQTNKHHKQNGENKPAEDGSDFKATIFKKFISVPLFIRVGDGYKLELLPSESACADIRIMPISVEGALNYIPNILVEAVEDGKKLEVCDDLIKNVQLIREVKTVISLKILNNFEYALDCDVFVGGNKNG